MLTPKEFNILSAGDMSAATLTSASVDLTFYVLCAIQAVFTGSPVGTFKLQISNDNVTFTDYTGSSEDISAAGNFMWNLLFAGYRYVRLVYTKTSGTGTLNVTVMAKG